MALPKNMQAVVLGKAEGAVRPASPVGVIFLNLPRKTAGKPGQVYHPISVETISIPELRDDQVLVKLHAAALNHRDVFIRQCSALHSLCPSSVIG